MSYSLNASKQHIDAHIEFQDALPMWVIYRPTTKDYPGQWVARMHLTLPEPSTTHHIIFGDSLESVQAQIPPGLINIGRMPEDDPVIEEVWL